MMSIYAIYQILAYTPMPDWLFYPMIALPLAFIVAVLGDAALERWRVWR